MYLLARLVIEREPGGFELAKTIIFKEDPKRKSSSCIDLNCLHYHDYKIVGTFTKEDIAYLILEKWDVSGTGEGANP